MRRKRTYKEAQALMEFSCPPVSKDSQKATMNKWASYCTHASIDAWLARAAYDHRGVLSHQCIKLQD